MSRGNHGGLVYYLRVGDRCKIGYSENLVARLETLRPEELLAVERGTVRLERQRHEQFRELRTRWEWFRYEGALQEHVAELRGNPVLRGWLDGFGLALGEPGALSALEVAKVSRAGRPRALSVEQEHRMCAQYETGKSAEELSQLYKVGVATVYRVVARAGGKKVAV